MKKYVFQFALVLCVAVGALAQATPPQPSPKMVAANELYQQKKYPEAAAAYGEITKSEPQNGRAWYFLAMSYHTMGKYDQAAMAFEKNLTINPQNANSMYNLACAYSRLKQADKAFEWLNKTISTAPALATKISSDEDLENIRGDARFAKALDALDRAIKPCMYAAENHQFDFWIGNWDVLTTTGQKAGTNNVISFADGCSVMENWTSTVAGTGKSINYYDPTTKKWYQFWIGSGGGALRYSGEFRDGAMRFEADTINANGKKVLNHLTFSKNDDGSVRQLAEVSNDEGKTWTVSYDFKYVRAKQ